MNDHKTELEQMRKDLDEIKAWLEHHDKMTRVYSETIINYARRNHLTLTPEMTKDLEIECISRSSKEGEPYDERPRVEYGCGYTAFKHHIVKYVFDHYYDELKKKYKEKEGDDYYD